MAGQESNRSRDKTVETHGEQRVKRAAMVAERANVRRLGLTV